MRERVFHHKPTWPDLHCPLRETFFGAVRRQIQLVQVGRIAVYLKPTTRVVYAPDGIPFKNMGRSVTTIAPIYGKVSSYQRI